VAVQNRIGRSAAVTAALVFGVHTLAAQTSFEIAPFVAYYRPTLGLAKVQETATWLPQSPQDLTGAAYGVDARWWFHNQVGLQLQAGVAFSNIRIEQTFPLSSGSQPPTQSPTLGAQVQIASVQVMSNMAPTNASYRVWASAGPAVIHRGGESYNFDPTITKSFDPGLALGLGGDIPVARRMRATIGVNSLMYWVHVDNPEDHHSIERGFQNDLLFHAGISWALQ
jgi:hypothetical protein